MMDCIKIAEQFVEDKFPDSIFALVAGSAIDTKRPKTIQPRRMEKGKI